MYVCKYVNFYERDLALPLYNPKPIVIAKQAETKKRHVTLAWRKVIAFNAANWEFVIENRKNANNAKEIWKKFERKATWKGESKEKENWMK